MATDRCDLSELYSSELARSMRDEFDPARFADELSAHAQATVPHERLMLAYLEHGGQSVSVFAEHATRGPLRHKGPYTIAFDPGSRYRPEDVFPACVVGGQAEFGGDSRVDHSPGESAPEDSRFLGGGPGAWLAVPLRGAQGVIGALTMGGSHPEGYGSAYVAAAQHIARLVGPLVEGVVHLHRERRRGRRLRVLPEVARVVGTSLNLEEIFDQLGAAVRPVLDFDIMVVRLLQASGAFEDRHFIVSPGPPAAPPEIQPGHFSFFARILAREPVLMRDGRVELDGTYPGDRFILERGVLSSVSVPLVFGEHVGGVLVFAKRSPAWYDESDLEVAAGIAAQVVVALQHQRLAEEQRRLAAAEWQARQLARRVERLRGTLSEQHGFDRLIGQAPALREAIERAARAAPTETTVLLTGESGTGKEVVARALHYASRRAESPFVAVNCAALPETLIESELFGHERGAFTGADRQKPGRFELAAGGTLFLDEIGELAPAVQAKLLRVLQEHEFQRVGGTATLRADIRLIVATNQNLERAVERGQFREDLYYRLNVFGVRLPPLRERGEDVLLLAEHFIRDLGERMGRGEPGLSQDARELLLAYAWPGNIRELQNAIERALIVSDGGLLTAAQLGLSGPRRDGAGPSPPAGGAPAPPQSLYEVERQAIVDALARANGNKTHAAAALGITRFQLYTRLRRLGVASEPR